MDLEVSYPIIFPSPLQLYRNKRWFLIYIFPTLIFSSIYIPNVKPEGKVSTYLEHPSVWHLEYLKHKFSIMSI